MSYPFSQMNEARGDPPWESFENSEDAGSQILRSNQPPSWQAIVCGIIFWLVMLGLAVWWIFF